MNTIFLSGRLTADVENLITATGSFGAKGCLAVQRNSDEADFINFTAWGKTAQFLIAYTGKGAYVTIEGSVRQSKWTDSDGNTKSRLEVVANRVEAPKSANAQATPSADMAQPVTETENLPF